MKQTLRHIFLLLALFMATTNAWALRYAKAIAKSSPEQGGWVWVTKTEGNAPSTWDRTEDSSEDYNLKTSNYTFPFYYFAKPQEGYEFKGWATASNTNTLSSTVQTNWYVGVTATSSNNVSSKPATVTYFAIFAKLTTDVSSLNFEKNVDEGWGAKQSLVATYVHAGDVVAKISGEHASDFSFSNSSLINQKTIASNNTDVESNQTVYIYFNPSGSGNRTAILTFSGNGMSKTVVLNGKGIKLDQTLSWDNESAIETNMQLGKTQTVTATATSGLTVTYSSSDNNFLTVDANGKITAVGIGRAIITASQVGNYKYNAASITKEYTVWNKNTPIFTPNGFNEANVCHLEVGDKVTLEVLNVSDGLSGDFKVKTDNNILGITRNGNTITIEALNAGTADAIFTQTENNDIFSAEKKYQFSVSKINNTLAIASSSYTKYVDDVIADIISSVNSDATVTTSSSDATIAYYDVASDKIVIPNSEAKSFSSQTVTITIAQADTYKYTAAEKTITLTVNKYDVEASISQSTAVWNEIIDNPFSLSYGLIDFDVESKNTNIAEYHKETKKIQTYFTDGTASFQITRPEDYKYNELDLNLDLEVKTAGGCDVLNAPDEVSLKYSVVWQDRIYEPTSFTGIPNELTFYTYKTAGTAVGDIEVQQYVNNKWIAVKDHSNNDVKIDATTSYKKYGPYTLDESATKMRFYNGYGSYKRYFKNVQVTRKAYLRPSTTELTLPQTNIGKSSENTFNLSWSTCFDDIKLLSNNDLFEVGTTQINTTAHTGTTNNILVRFKGANEPGTYSAVITIYDQSQSKEVHVSCNVKDRLTTKIVYTGESQYSEVHDCIKGLFSVIDNETGNTITGANIVLTSSNKDILEICDNAGFMPHCGGPVTLTANYAGDEIYAPAEWSREITVANCYQTINWEQDFRQFIAAEDGTISQRIELTAKAVPTDFAITYELDEAAQKFASLENQDGKWFLIIFGVGTGHIIATSPAGTFETKYYDETSLMHEIRVHKWGEKCNTDEIVTSREVTLSDVLAWWPIETQFELDGRPYARMEFYSHVSNESWYNDLTVSFSTDGGATWTNSKTFYDIPNTYNWNTPYVHDNIPEGANRVKFRTNSTTNTYFNMVKMVQKTYLEPNVTEIRIDDAIVNKQFSREFKIKYSDIPLLQYVISDSHDLGLKLTSTPPVANDCGDWGEYTFTLTGESPYPQTNVTETITFYTSAGDVVNIPVTITATLSDTYYFNQQAGNWGDLNNWQVKGATPTKLPTASNPIVISKPLTINESELVAYGVTIAEGGSVNIQPKGGLTLHAGGFAEGVTNDNFTIENNQDGVGYVRVSPYFINKVSGEMPNITVQYTTRAKAGGAKDQVWQYVGAPGNNMQMSNDGVMVYLWSETDGWVYSNTNMTPFEGYALTRTAEGTETYSIVAQPIHDNQTINLTKTANGMNGDNLFVNSYLAPIDLTKFTTDGEDSDFTGNVEKTFYLFNSGSWNDWQGKNGEGANQIIQGESAGQYYAITPLGAALIDANKDQTTIPPMQGVYVVANGEAQIHLKYNKHVFRSTSPDMNRPMRAPQIKDENFMRVRMQVNSQNSGADRMYVIQYENTTRGYDNGYDAKNIIAQGQANIYTNEPEGQMEISVADQIDSTFIGFAAGEDSEYTLTFTSLVGQDMYLHDLESDSLFLITEEGQYTFSAHPNSVNDMRFQLLLYPDFSDDLPGNGVTTGIDNLVSSAQVWVNDKRVYIADAPQNSKLVLYTANGMCITSPLTIHHTPCTIDLSHLPTGVYVLRLNNQAYKFVCK